MKFYVKHVYDKWVNFEDDFKILWNNIGSF